jgi:hypothetical protein
MEHTSAGNNLPARLAPTLLSTEAANLIHSVVYDAESFGVERQDGFDADIHASAIHLSASRMKLVRYISHLEHLLHIPQHQFYRFD